MNTHAQNAAEKIALISYGHVNHAQIREIIQTHAIEPAVKELQDKLTLLENQTNSIHSCSDDCQRFGCVQRRKIEATRALLNTIRQHAIDVNDELLLKMLEDGE